MPTPKCFSAPKEKHDHYPSVFTRLNVILYRIKIWLGQTECCVMCPVMEVLFFIKTVALFKKWHPVLESILILGTQITFCGIYGSRSLSHD